MSNALHENLANVRIETDDGDLLPAMDVAGEKLAQLILAVSANQKPGTLTLKITVRPSTAGALAVKAELAPIGCYYATESMLVLDPATGLINGPVFAERLARMVARSQRLKHQSVVLVIDLTNVEQIQRDFDRRSAEELPLRVAAQAVDWPPGARLRVAGVSSFGLSGTNAHIVLTEAPKEVSAAPEPLRLAAWPFPLSATSDAALRAQAGQLAAHLSRAPAPQLAELSYSLATTRAAPSPASSSCRPKSSSSCRSDATGNFWWWPCCCWSWGYW